MQPIKSYSSLKHISAYSVLVLITLWVSVSCNKPNLITNSSAKLTFSQTKITFDTVFTTEGSTFQYFTIHNTHNQPIKISSITLVGTYTSPFKLNVDGTPGTSFANITIPANDSIFAFVTVTLNPNNVNNPVVIQDSIQFVTNGNQQYVDLTAIGQDVYLYKPNVFPSSGPAYSALPCGTVWKNDKPHVVFGYLVVDSGCTLTMQSGTKVYMHNSSVLYVNKGGTLLIEGLYGQQVVIQGDRLDPTYVTQPGQWGEICLSPGSINDSISWAVIKNGTIGIEVDTVGNNQPTLRIDHTIIKSMSEFALLGQGSYIKANNCVFADCQYYCVNLSLGGNYYFGQCTIANYWSYGQRQTTALLINNWYQDIYGNYDPRPLTRAFFGNCIISGSLSEELDLDSTHGGSDSFKYYFENCCLLTQQNITNPYHWGSTNYLASPSSQPSFYNTSTDDYEIHTSCGSGDGIICGIYPEDLNGQYRSCPGDLGAYKAH